MKKKSEKKAKPKNKIKSKTEKNKALKKYTVKDIQKAIEAIKEEKITLRQAAEKYNVPKTTLHNKYSGKNSLDARKGPATYLTLEEENNIVDWIIECTHRGFPITKSRLLDSVQQFILESKRETPFKNGRRGIHWYQGFMRRHPALSLRLAQNLTCTRASVSEEKVKEWFAHVKKHLEEKDLLNIDASRVFNLDESAFQLVPKTEKVIAPKGSRAVYKIVSSSEKATVTVLFTGSASGKLAPPLVLFDVKTTPRRSTLQYIPKGWGVGNSESGWMTGESFYSFMKNIFYKHLLDSGCEFPVVVYVDNHSSHVNLQLLEFCKEKKIELIALYPNSTHLIQPLDVGFFRPLKEAYKKALLDYKVKNNIVDFKKQMVALVLQQAIESMDFEKGLKSGFRASGLYPFNVDAVDFDIFNKKNKQRKADELSQDSENTVDMKALESLKFLESNLITPSTLDLFLEQEFEEEWSGDISEKALFEVWKKLRRLSGIQNNF